MSSSQHNHDGGHQTPDQPLSILVVEDHADTRRSLELFLGMLGYRACCARGMQEALTLAATEASKFDLLLTDLQLADGDGWELLRRLREENRAPAGAIAVSGWGSNDDLAKSQAVGFHAHLVKPPTPQTLLAVLQEAAAAV